MSARPFTPVQPARRRTPLKAATAVAALSLSSGVLAACGSSSPHQARSSSTTTSTTTPAQSLSALETWPTTAVTLQETGSDLLAPLFLLWSEKIHQEWPAVSLATAGHGSDTGVASAAAGSVNLGASDAYLSAAQMQQYPALLNVPLVVAPMVVIANVPGVTGRLNLDGPTIAAMYMGKITNWNDPKIAAMNPGITLPNLAVAPVHRSDSSDDTLWFTTYLAAADPTGWGQRPPPGPVVPWPIVAGQVAVNGDAGVVAACQRTKGCISYLAGSFLSQASSVGLTYFALKNKAGHFEIPSMASIAAAATGLVPQTPASGAVSMVFGPAPDGYPIVNYEYAIVPSKQPSALAAQAVRASLAWSLDPSGGSAPAYLDQFDFAPLPDPVLADAAKLIAQIAS
ncbi:MAG TPA: phosphate ABC transporter substrate-binding protein PstS [Acidimicrobiales bacterium]|nr:phosphate ABC transporter substrate-binding protein PstS [Acidimicrobiales bacterium]